jgi:16S rRNA (guanine527-N7)-methyltransferase
MSKETLAAVAERYGVRLPGEQIELLERYCTLLWDWNTKINLTRHTDYEKFVTRDLADSLAFAEFLGQKEKLVDVGSGGGVPGVVLAVVRPDLEVTLTESTGKKAKVLDDMCERLGLRVSVYHGRAEHLLADRRQDVLVIRAVARLEKLLEWFRPLWGRFGRMLVLKGPSWVDERGEARHLGRLHGMALRKLKSYLTAGTGAESVLLELRPESGKSGEVE